MSSDIEMPINDSRHSTKHLDCANVNHKNLHNKVMKASEKAFSRQNQFSNIFIALGFRCVLYSIYILFFLRYCIVYSMLRVCRDSQVFPLKKFTFTQIAFINYESNEENPSQTIIVCNNCEKS